MLRTLEIITIVVPPALPAAMRAGVIYSQNRLKKLGIYCVSHQGISVCGKFRLVSLDKVCQNVLLYKILDFSEIFSYIETARSTFPIVNPCSCSVVFVVSVRFPIFEVSQQI
jgi:cation-transporting ATPase 13A3/4/5